MLRLLTNNTKRENMMKKCTILICWFILFISPSYLFADADSSNPAKVEECNFPDDMNCFKNGEIADAKTINANFKALLNRINSKLNVDENGDLKVNGHILGKQWRDYRAFIRFIKDDGVTSEQLCPEGGVPTISTSPEQSLNLFTGNEICQNSYYEEKTCINVHALAPCSTINTNFYPYEAKSCDENFSGQWAPFHWYTDISTHEVTTHMLGSGIACYSVKYACCK